MGKRILYPILFLLIPVVANAADISGFVRDSNNRPVAGAKVEYKCGERIYEGSTNKYGRYRVTGLPKVTWCSVEVNGEGTV